MSLVSRPLLRRVARRNPVSDAKRELRELATKSFKSAKRFDVFLSHRYFDADQVLALKSLIEYFGFSVFVDWIETPGLDRGKVTKETAGYLRTAMEKSASLLYAVSDNSSDSKWMPWELGYSDALHGRVAVVPVTDQETTTESYRGQEYLGLYSYLTIGTDKSGQEKVWINDSASTYTTLEAWLKGTKPSYRSS